jgi:hypothetical protein
LHLRKNSVNAQFNLINLWLMEDVCNKKDNILVHEWTNLEHISRVGNYK